MAQVVRFEKPWTIGFGRNENGFPRWHILICCHCGTDCADELYMVQHEMWEKATAPLERGGYLHFRCLEARLGRHLTHEDFIDVLCNHLPAVGHHLSQDRRFAPCSTCSRNGDRGYGCDACDQTGLVPASEPQYPVNYEWDRWGDATSSGVRVEAHRQGDEQAPLCERPVPPGEPDGPREPGGSPPATSK